MYVTRVPNRKSRPTILLRESYREDGKVKNRTIANLTHLDPSLIEALKVLFAQKSSEPLAPFHVRRSLPHGHAAVVLEVAEQLGLRKILGRSKGNERDLALALIVLRVLQPGSKASSARALSDATATTSLGQLLQLPELIEPNDIYLVMDWLLRRQRGIEKRLAAKHLQEGCVVLYDLTSTWVEGSKCELAKRGYSRDKKTGKDQIEFALVTDGEGRPIGVEVFEGNVSDPATVAPLLRKVKDRFGLSTVVIVGDRGMLTGARIREDVQPIEGVDFVTGLRKPSIRKLLDQGDIQLGLFDDIGLVEVESDCFPGSRLVVCRNPLEADAQKHRRQVRINRAVTALAKVQDATRRDQRPLRGESSIARRVGKVFGRHRGTEKFFTVTFTDNSLNFGVNKDVVAAEARLDGLYVIRTSVPKEQLAPEEAVRLYKSLSHVERDFRTMKSADIDVRPIFHRRADRVRAHVLLCMLALYVRKELEKRLAPMLYVDEERASNPENPVRPAVKSAKAKHKAAQHTDPQGHPIQSLRQALRCLSSLTHNFVCMDKAVTEGFWTTSKPTPVQAKLLEQVGLTL